MNTPDDISSADNPPVNTKFAPGSTNMLDPVAMEMSPLMVNVAPSITVTPPLNSEFESHDSEDDITCFVPSVCGSESPVGMNKIVEIINNTTIVVTLRMLVTKCCYSSNLSLDDWIYVVLVWHIFPTDVVSNQVEGAV